MLMPPLTVGVNSEERYTHTHYNWYFTFLLVLCTYTMIYTSSKIHIVLVGLELIQCSVESL